MVINGTRVCEQLLEGFAVLMPEACLTDELGPSSGMEEAAQYRHELGAIFKESMPRFGICWQRGVAVNVLEPFILLKQELRAVWSLAIDLEFPW